MAKRGPKRNADFTKPDSMIEVLKRKDGEFDQKIINNMDRMYDTLFDMGMAEGEFDKIGVKDRKTALMYMIDRIHESYLGESDEDDEDGAEHDEEVISGSNVRKLY